MQNLIILKLNALKRPLFSYFFIFFSSHAFAISTDLNKSNTDKEIKPKEELNKTERRIQHPLSRKGLIRITKDRKYIYKTPRSPQTATSTISFATWEPLSLANPSNNVSYSSIYDNAIIFFGDYEWPFYKFLGLWNFKLGSGLGLSSGNGILVDSDNSIRSQAEEAFSLFTFPNHASLIYRMKFWDKQPIVPYAEAGLAYYGFIETRDDGASPKLKGSPGFQFVFGGALDLSFFEHSLINNLDAEYGINNLSFNLEFKILNGLDEDFDISSETLSFGFMLDY